MYRIALRSAHNFNVFILLHHLCIFFLPFRSWCFNITQLLQKNPRSRADPCVFQKGRYKRALLSRIGLQLSVRVCTHSVNQNRLRLTRAERAGIPLSPPTAQLHTLIIILLNSEK
jgi:hypothetical protein